MDEKEVKARVFQAGLRCLHAVDGMAPLEATLAMIAALGELATAGHMNLEDIVKNLRDYVAGRGSSTSIGRLERLH